MDRTWSLLEVFRGSNAPAGMLRILLLSAMAVLAQAAQAGIVLEGQNKGDTTHWYAGNLQNWQELDFIPCRVHFSSAQGNNQTITLYFEHRNNNVPGIQNLFYFTASNNVVLTAPAVLSSPAGSSTWSYTLSVNVLNNQDGYIWFSSRLAAGAHLNVGSSLHLSGNPSSMGTLQIHKPQARVGNPNLSVFKRGPSSAAPGDQITYTLTYTNKLGSTDHGTGVQLSDILPPGLTVNRAGLPAGGLLVGNTIYWDLPDLNAGVGGTVSFQAMIATNAAYGSTLTNYGQILSAENDCDYSDNETTWITTLISCNPPRIVTPPANQTNCPGTTASFTVSATGTILAYQWYKNSGLLSGATSSALVITNVSAVDGATYQVVVSGACGACITNSALLVVNQGVVVALPPSNQTNCAGTTATFSVSATGSGIAYQWFRGSTLLAGQTRSTLAITNVNAASAGTYGVVVSGICSGSVTNSALLVVNENLIVATPPANQTNCSGTTAVFNVSATGTGISYQWYKGSGLLAGKTDSSLLLTNVSSANAGIYSVVITAACGGPLTNSAALVVNENVVVATPPSNQTNCPGTTAIFNITASGIGIGYQWYKGTTLLGGETGPSLTLANISSVSAGTYYVVVTGACGKPVTNSAVLTVNESLTISTPPSNQTNCPGTTAIFNVAASGTGIAYQWYKGTTLLAGQTGPTLALSSVTASNAGVYSVVVSGTCGISTTNSALLVINDSLIVATPPSNQTNCPGTIAIFGINASGTGIAYQWYKAATLLVGQTASTLTITNVTSTNAGIYSVVVSGTCSNPITNSAVLVVNQNLLVATSPSNQTNCPGTTAIFAINASGTGINYQWFKESSLLLGETGSSLTITDVTPATAGIYSVVISGACDNPITNSAALVVNENVFVATALTNQTNCPGTTATFSISASGTAISHAWYYGSSLIAGETNASLTITNVSPAQAGLYSVVISGACGNPITNSATLFVNENVSVTAAPSNQTNCPGTTAIFSIAASGTGVGYQWYKGSLVLAGKTASTLTITNVSVTNAGIYSVVVSGTCGNPITNLAVLVVNENVVVSTAPSNQTNCPGTTAIFSISGSGTGIGYQWYKGSSLLANETASALTITNVTATNAGIYSVVVTGTCGNPIANSAMLVVNENVLVSTAPSSQTNCPGTTAIFSISATGTGIWYQWYKGTSLLPAETSSSLTITNVSVTNAGIYSVVVSGTCGNPVTNSAVLVVNENVVVSTAPSNQTNCPGTTAIFSITASGTGIGYQWYKGSSLLAGETNSSLIITNVSATNAGLYSIGVSGTCGNPITNSASLVVNDNLIISNAPVNQTNCPGTTASFSITASGTAIAYQWYKNSSPLTGETNAILTIPNITSLNGGSYSVIVSGACGITTNSALLLVNDATFASSLVGGIRNLGESFTFSTIARGTGPFTYLWKKNGTVIPGATTNSLTLSNLTFTDAASYSVEVSGTCNTAVQSASLAVNHPPTVEIFTPTNGAIFIAPAAFTLGANAVDTDGIVTNVEFFLFSTNKLGETTNSAPASLILTNLAAGNYTFTARATDDLNAQGTSTPVTISVTPHLPLTITSSIHFNPQTGLYEQTVRVFNPTYSDINAVRVYVSNIDTNTTHVYNASGFLNGTAFVESHALVNPGFYVQFVIEYYVPTRVQPNPVLTADLVPLARGGGSLAVGTQQHIDRGIMLLGRVFLVEFLTVSNRLYSVQYSPDLKNWQDAQPSVRGNGTRIQWLDDGEPKTVSDPDSVPARFYRVILLP